MQLEIRATDYNQFQDKVRKGLPEPVVLFRHVFRNALIPIITSAGSFLP